MEDRLLVWRFKLGSREALCRIYEKYENHMLTLAISLLNDVSTAEDVVHDVFVSFAQSAERIRLTGNLKNYIAASVANRARDKIRARQRQLSSLNKVEPVSSNSNDAPESLIYDEQSQQLTKAMAELPYEQREVIMLHLQGGMTFRAIASSQGLSINTVRSRYRYGLDRLRSLLNAEVEK